MRVRAHASEAAREVVTARRKATSSAELARDDASRALAAERASQDRVRAGEDDALAAGELRAVDLERRAGWGLAASALEQARAAARDDAERALASARAHEEAALQGAARARVDEKLAVDAEARWRADREAREAEARDEDALDAWAARHGRGGQG